MEVHHHSHTARRKWSHYFWEFLMLFLAVFCGFLAEYWLEHIIEDQREKKYAISLLEDLKKDATELEADLFWWNKHANRIDSIYHELDQPTDKRNLLLLYRNAAFIRQYNGFEYHDRTIDQLKNAGFFRLFRNKNVADSLMDYDARVKSTLLNIESGANTIYLNLNFSQNKIFNSKYFLNRFTTFNLDSLYKTNPEKFAIRDRAEDQLFEYSNNLLYYKGNTYIRIYVMGGLLNKARALSEMIKKEYHLK